MESLDVPFQIHEDRPSRGEKGDGIFSFIAGQLHRAVFLIFLALFFLTSVACSQKSSETVAVKTEEKVEFSLKKAVLSLSSGDYPKALGILRSLAESGDPESQYLLGEMHSKGLGLTQDYAATYRWYMKSARQNHPQAQYAVASLYAYGLGVERDYAQASIWSERAYQNGFQQTNEQQRKIGKIAGK